MVDIYAETKEANTSPNSPFGKNVSIAGYAKSCPSLSFSIFGKDKKKIAKMKICDMILFAIAYILFVSSRVRAERLSMSGVASVWKRNGGSSSSCPTAVAVAWAESRGDTKARGQNSNSYDRGLWQINSYWHRDVSDSCAYDKNCNAKNAVRISSNGRKWSPWATYNDGLHRRWMNDAKKAGQAWITPPK